MKSLIEAIRDLCLLRRGPQDLPHAPSLLQALILLGIALSLVVSALAAPLGRVAPTVLVAYALLLGLPAAALALAGRGARFVQTAIAIVGCDVAFTLLSVPIVLGIGVLPERGEEMTTGQVLLAWAALALIAWQLAVRGHILRHALEVPLRYGVLIAAVFFAIESLLTAALFPRGA